MGYEKQACQKRHPFENFVTEFIPISLSLKADDVFVYLLYFTPNNILIFSFAGMANKAFMDETKKVFKNPSAGSCRFWRTLEASEDPENIYHFCMKLFEAVTTSNKDQILDEEHEAMYSTLMLLEFYKNTKLKPEKWLQETERIFE